MPRHRFRANLQALTQLLGWMYISAIAVWFGLRLVFFDRFWWLALLNTLAFYLLQMKA
jgi:hypothetical protein